jgi:hypothetical protein
VAAEVNAGAARVLRDGVLWHTAPSFGRSVAYTLMVIVAALAVERSAWSADATSFSDGHAIVSLDLALARAFCGIPSSFATSVRIPKDIGARMALRQVPLRTLIVDKAGSIDAYCRAIDTPFVNSENSLMLLESAVLRTVPGLSLAQLGAVLHWIRIACIAAFVLLLIDLGSSILLGLATFLCGLMLLQSMPDYVYSNYPFLFTLVLLDVAVTGFAIKYRWTRTAPGLVLSGAGAGLLVAFIANMRTSYLPIAGLFFVLVLVDELRSRGRRMSLSRRSLRGLVLAGCFLAAYQGFQVGLITRHQPPEARYNAAHPLGHPLVLALAIPENTLSREQGIRWADEAGPLIAARVDPGATFMGPRYNAALLRYYGGLWRTHPREMLAVYALKFSTAGSDMLRVLRRSPGTIGWAVGVLLAPIAMLPNGLWLLALYAAITAGAFAAYYARNLPAAFAMALLSLAACLVQIESGVIFSIFVKQYHNYAAFYVLFLSLLGVQLLVNAAWALAARLRSPEPPVA